MGQIVEMNEYRWSIPVRVETNLTSGAGSVMWVWWLAWCDAIFSAWERALQMIGDGGHAKVIRDIDPNAYVIAIGNNRIRKKIAMEHGNDQFDVVIHPTAWVSPNAKIGEGTVIMAHAVVQAGTRIGMHCILNSGAVADHDCVIEDFAHIAPGAHLCGGVRVGEGALVGVCQGVMPGAVIPAWTVFPFGREIE